jgi:hypothetical protein
MWLTKHSIQQKQLVPGVKNTPKIQKQKTNQKKKKKKIRAVVMYGQEMASERSCFK